MSSCIAFERESGEGGMVDPNSRTATKETANHATDDVACLRHWEWKEQGICTQKREARARNKREATTQSLPLLSGPCENENDRNKFLDPAHVRGNLA